VVRIVAAWGIVYVWSVATALIMTFVALVTPLSAFLLLPVLWGSRSSRDQERVARAGEADTTEVFLNVGGMQWLGAPSDEQ